MQPLTRLSEEEELFQTTVRQFARERLAPHVRAMDEAGVFRKELLDELFELGLMAIDVPEEYGGQGGSFFQSILAIEELAKVDPSAAVIVDVQNTLIQQRASALGERRSEAPLSAASRARHRGVSYALSEAGVGLGRVRADDARRRRRRPLPAHRPQALDHQRGRSRFVPGVRQR